MNPNPLKGGTRASARNAQSTLCGQRSAAGQPAAVSALCDEVHANPLEARSLRIELDETTETLVEPSEASSRATCHANLPQHPREHVAIGLARAAVDAGDVAVWPHNDHRLLSGPQAQRSA